MELPDGVRLKKGVRPGNKVAIVGGVHGNEKVGIEALEWAYQTINPERGSIYFIKGNPEAVEQGVRFIEKNLNRCFVDHVGSSLEERRAKELVPIFDKCDAMIDVHASNSAESTPFVICEKNGIPFAEKLNFPIISYGWDALEPGGTDGYMNRQGKMGITLECGSVLRPEEYLPLAKESLLIFLQHMQIIGGKASSVAQSHRYIEVHTVEHKSEEEVVFSKDYVDFQPLVSGEIFARQGNKEYVAKQGDCIIFPRPNAKLGAEIFLLGKEVQYLRE